MKVGSIIRQVLATVWFVAILGLAPLDVQAQMPMMAGSAGSAEATAELPDPLTPEAIDALVARLDDADVRNLLIQQLDRVATSSGAGDEQDLASLVSDIEGKATIMRGRLAEILGAATELPGVLPFAFNQLTEGMPWWHPLRVTAGFLAMMATGLAGEWLFSRVTRNIRQRIREASSDKILAKLGFLLLRIVIELLNVGVFVLAALAFFFAVYQGHEPSRQLIMTYLTAVVVVRIVAVVARFFLAPNMPVLRCVPLSDGAATYLYRWVIKFSAVWAFGLLTCGLLRNLGLDENVHLLLVKMVSIVIVAMLIHLVLKHRTVVADSIRGRRPSGRLRQMFADIWHIPAIIYVLVIWSMGLVQDLLGIHVNSAAGIGSLLIIIAVPLADRAVEYGLKAFRDRDRDPDEVPSEEADEEEAPDPFMVVWQRAARFAIGLAAIWFFAAMWGFNLFSVAAEGVGESFSRAILDVGFTLLLAYIGWQIISIVIDSQMDTPDESEPAEVGGEGGHGGASRIQTLLPLFKKVLQVTLAVMVIMIILSSLGVDIGPLIAGAGVIGLAIGFGAQTLVRDIVSGVFFLVDDAFRVGEYIDLGDVKGTVENISIRSLQLRHHRGAVHTVPFGEMKHITNYSRDWVIMKLQFRVTYDTDPMVVKKIVKRIGAELMADPELGPNFLDPLKSQGVLAMEDSAMILRVKFTAKPGEQFVIRREVYHRIQKAFAENGIEFAHREVTVHVPEGADVSPQQAAAAAQSSLAQAEAAAKPAG